MSRAWPGSSSPNWTPGTVVRMAPNGPRYGDRGVGLGVPGFHVPGPAAEPEEDDSRIADRGCRLGADAKQVRQGQAAQPEQAGLEKAAAGKTITMACGISEDAEHGGVSLGKAGAGGGRNDSFGKELTTAKIAAVDDPGKQKPVISVSWGVQLLLGRVFRAGIDVFDSIIQFKSPTPPDEHHEHNPVNIMNIILSRPPTR